MVRRTDVFQQYNRRRAVFLASTPVFTWQAPSRQPPPRVHPIAAGSLLRHGGGGGGGRGGGGVPGPSGPDAQPAQVEVKNLLPREAPASRSSQSDGAGDTARKSRGVKDTRYTAARAETVQIIPAPPTIGVGWNGEVVRAQPRPSGLHLPPF